MIRVKLKRVVSNNVQRFFSGGNSYYEKFADGTVVCIDDEIPFAAPSGWEWIRLGALIDFSKSGSVKSYCINKEAWILDLEDIEKDTGKLLQKKRMKDVNSKSDKHPFSKGCVLYSKLRPYLNKVIIADEDGYCTTEILSFDFGHIYNCFAQVYLMSPFFVEYAMKDAYGVKMPRLGSKQGNAALMPIPPLEEQKRIVNKIDEIKPWIERYRRSQEQLDLLNKEIKDRLKKSILQEAIQGHLVTQKLSEEPASVLLDRVKSEKLRLLKEGRIKKSDIIDSVIFKGEDNKYYEKVGNKVLDISEEIPFDIPAAWEWCRLGALMAVISDGTHKTPTYVDRGIPFLSVQNISSGELDVQKIKFISEQEHQQLCVRVTPQKNDILICRIGTLGKALKVYWDFEFSIFVSLGLLRPVASEIADYIVLCINSPLGYHWIQNNKVGGGTHTFKINLTDIPNMLVCLPPIDEQKRIVERLSTITSTMR